MSIILTETIFGVEQGTKTAKNETMISASTAEIKAHL